MKRKKDTCENSKKKAFFCTKQLLALVLTMVMMIGTAMTFAACGNKTEETVVDLTETETISANDETATDDAEEATGEVSEDNSEENTDESAEAGTDEAGTDTETADGTEAEDEESTSVLDDTTKAVNVTETEAVDANGYTYTMISDTIMYVKQQVNVRSIPSKEADKLGSLSAGTPVTVTGQCNETGWYRIAFNGGTGYVSNNYLTSNKSEVDTTTTQASTTTKKNSESSTTTKKNTETTTTKASSKSYSSVSEKVADLGFMEANLTESEIETLCEEYSEEVVRLVNVERAKENLPALGTDSLLTEAAMIRAEEVATLFAHTRPDGTKCFTVLSQVGRGYTEAGENIDAYSRTPEMAMEDWMNSTGHRGNIMDQPFVLDDSEEGYTYVNSYVEGYYGYDTIGVGVYYDKTSNIFYWVQIFIHAHTHVWRTEATNVYTYYDGLIWTLSPTVYGLTDNDLIAENVYMCTDSNCDAYKDQNGVIYDHWR
ncbi:MAG: SH3 domain-containing protein [Lachnospiraceae bacterium]|nr:SH3 domain-containing protein [Lachnospiraceae bacterium]